MRIIAAMKMFIKTTKGKRSTQIQRRRTIIIMYGLENNRVSNEHEQVCAPCAAGADLFEDWKNGWGRRVPSETAKREYFLTARDLATIIYVPVGGGPGNGPPMKYYSHSHLVSLSLNKHGRCEVTRKLEARYKREEKKRKQAEEDEQARKRLKIFNPIADDDRAAEAAAAAIIKATVGDTQEVKNLRGALLKMAKKKLGFTMYGDAKNWSVRVNGISKATFAALVGQSTDVDLDTFTVQNDSYTDRGAYYEEEYEASKLFDTPKTLMYKEFEREQVTQEIGSFVVARYQPSTKELSIEGTAECFDW
jgi:hypothetical protein